MHILSVDGFRVHIRVRGSHPLSTLNILERVKSFQPITKNYFRLTLLLGSQQNQCAIINYTELLLNVISLLTHSKEEKHVSKYCNHNGGIQQCFPFSEIYRTVWFHCIQQLCGFNQTDLQGAQEMKRTMHCIMS